MTNPHTCPNCGNQFHGRESATSDKAALHTPEFLLMVAKDTRIPKDARKMAALLELIEALESPDRNVPSDGKTEATKMTADVCPECGSDEKSWRVTQGTGDDIIGTCQDEWHDQPAPTVDADELEAESLKERAAYMRAHQGDQPAPNEHSPVAILAPFPNCSYQICDLPGQCVSEGACHHPKEPASQQQAITSATVLSGSHRAESVGAAADSGPTEPVSATPRTDAAEQEHFPYIKIATLSRQLERELQSAEARAAELQAKLAAETARAHNAAIDKCYHMLEAKSRTVLPSYGAAYQSVAISDCANNILALKVPQ